MTRTVNGDDNVETLDAVLYMTDYINAYVMTDLNLDDSSRPTT